MDSTSREDLSALMDGELAAEPTRFLLRRLDHDPELSATWSRWHLIRACLASDPARMSTARRDDDFASRVAAAVAIDHVRPSVRRRHWVQYVGGGAVAAGVAVAALLLNAPGPHFGAFATTPAGQVAAAPSVATATPADAAGLAAAQSATPPWLLSRQPTVLAAQPASADVVYGTGLMQPDYLRRAAYAQATPAVAFGSPYFEGTPAQPFSIVLLPEPPAASAAAARPH